MSDDIISIHREGPIPPKATRVELWRGCWLVARFEPKTGVFAHLHRGEEYPLSWEFLAACADERKRWENKT